ncbi:MAG TPA: 5-(carboxyamino)imidazole ribonucleotide synthase [Tepidisphaeraceae bacterium]|jgi:5-(carboxyamino)imidazole ribonucleotide synthase
MTPGDLDPILPGSTIGVLGSGQLGRMFAIAARKMGYRVHTLSPDTDTPTGQVADVELVADYDDLDAVANFAREVNVVTFEFENVSSAAAEAAARFAPVRPAGRVLHTTQHRLREKTFLRENGFPVTRFAPIAGPDDLRAALSDLGTPAILKSAGFGYDAKGQFKITGAEQAQEAWRVVTAHLHAQVATEEGPGFGVQGSGKEAEKGTGAFSSESAIRNPQSAIAILEAFVPFEREVSVVAARSSRGDFAHWGVIENVHVNGILDLSTAPAAVADSVYRDSIEIAKGILDTLGVVGVLCVEFFVTRDGRLLVNELAPRPHNSGHLTFDASVTSQFEQQLRAVCNLPLGDTRLYGPAAMVQLLGDLWLDRAPDQPAPAWPAALANPNVKLHLYGKYEPRRGRKMGHLTAMASTVEEAREQVLAARRSLLAR